MNTLFFWDTVLVVTGITIATAIIALVWQRSFIATSNLLQFLLFLIGVVGIIVSAVALNNTELTMFHFIPLLLIVLLIIMIPIMTRKGMKESHMEIIERGNRYLKSQKKDFEKNDQSMSTEEQDEAQAEIIHSMKIQGKNDSLAA